MTTFLLEIGTEDLPADFLRLVLSQFQKIVQDDLDQSRVKYKQIRCSTTPRRIILLIDELSERGADSVEELKGPPADKAFQNNLPTQAAIGFANRCAVRTEDLQIRETTKGVFVFAKITESGKPISELLVGFVPKWIGDLQGRRFMKWGIGKRRFSRPIRWIVALLDDKLVPIQLDGCDPLVSSGVVSRGHRLFSDELVITSANDYSSILEKAGVQVDRSTRRSFIKKLISDEATQHNYFPELSDKLLDELTDLVESPSLVCGEFDKSFLNLPSEVLTTVMQVHQRYIPLRSAENTNVDPLSFDSINDLEPLFFCISNGLTSANSNIKKGNERVLKARLSDAKFFVEADLSVSCEDRRERLAGVSFAKGLGSLLDRVHRIEWLVETLNTLISGPETNPEKVKEAAYFCKHDLVSQIVGEFPELEGIMGGKYLLKEGKTREVALAVLEHYLPRGTSDSLPQSDTGCILALAERLELLISIFSQGKRPSGSSDPYALRRAGNGILLILWSKDWLFNLDEFLHKAVHHWAVILQDIKRSPEDLINDLSEFFRQRIISLLDDKGIDQDLILSIAGETIPSERLLSDLADIRLRADLLSEMRVNGELSKVHAVVTRASRLAEKSKLPSNTYSAFGVVDIELFEKESESSMINVINSLEPIAKGSSSDRYYQLASGLSAGTNVLSEFFDGDKSVMVMTDDLKVRSNRLNLLAVLCNQASLIADFNQINN